MNHRLGTALPPPAARDLNATLRSRGFEIEDFRLREISSSDLAESLGVFGGLISVRCRSTGEERLYSTGASSAWLGAFLMDLGKGCFADAARCPAAAYLPMSQQVPQGLIA